MFFGFVYFSRGNPPPKKGKTALLGDLGSVYPQISSHLQTCGFSSLAEVGPEALCTGGLLHLPETKKTPAALQRCDFGDTVDGRNPFAPLGSHDELVLVG